jgi:hypothetical protein
VLCDVARHGGQECGEPGACSARHFEIHLRHEDAARCNVDDTPEFLRHHRLERLLDQLDRGDHAADDAVQDLLPVHVVVFARWRPQVVGDENVGFRACSEQIGLTLRTGHIGGDCIHLDAERLAEVGRGCLGGVSVAAIDDDFAPGLRELLRARAAEPFA